MTELRKQLPIKIFIPAHLGSIIDLLGFHVYRFTKLRKKLQEIPRRAEKVQEEIRRGKKRQEEKIRRNKKEQEDTRKYRKNRDESAMGENLKENAIIDK